MDPVLETLLSAAVRAPSGDNTQPWCFEVDETDLRIALHLDPTRDPSPMNAGQRMARLALGAALENILCTARHNGWQADLTWGGSPALAAVRVHAPAGLPGQLEPAVASRVTNRRVYESRQVEPGVLAALQEQTSDLAGIHACWITEPQQLSALAALIGRADAFMFGARAIRHAFLGNVRFDQPADATVEAGLSLASLESSAADRLALRCLRRTPQWLVRCSGVLRLFAAKSRQLVESASGLCLIVAPDGREETDVLAGRLMQRAWLALTATGLAAQPMMSLLVLENIADHGSSDLVDSLGREPLAALRADFRTLVAEIDRGRPAFLLRFGYALPPSGQTGRLPLSAVTTTAVTRRTESVVAG